MTKKSKGMTKKSKGMTKKNKGMTKSFSKESIRLLLLKNNKSLCYIIVLVICLVKYSLLYAGYSGGAPGIEQKFSIDARMEGSAGAWEALSDDVSGIYYNPAGLALNKKTMVMGSYLPLWDSSTYAFFVGLSIQLKYFPVAIGTFNIITEDIPIRRDSPLTSGFVKYQNTLFFLCSAYKIAEGLSVGIRANIIYQSFEEYKDLGVGFDIGLLWRTEKPYSYTENTLLKILRPISFGIIFHNIIPPTIKMDKAEEEYPLMLKTGFSYRSPQIGDLLDIELGLNMASVPEYDINNLSIGSELGWWEFFYIRTGYRITEEQITIGSGFNARNITVDFGIRLLEVDKNMYLFDVKVKF